jgi:hypothetical protein
MESFILPLLSVQKKNQPTGRRADKLNHLEQEKVDKNNHAMFKRV